MRYNKNTQLSDYQAILPYHTTNLNPTKSIITQKHCFYNRFSFWKTPSNTQFFFLENFSNFQKRKVFHFINSKIPNQPPLSRVHYYIKKNTKNTQKGSQKLARIKLLLYLCPKLI